MTTRKHRPAGLSLIEAVQWHGYSVDSRGCHVWSGYLNDSGYGVFRHGGQRGKLYRAHRVVYEEHHGPIPEGMVIDHRCHNPACINLEHLNLVTYRQNGENRAGPNKRSAIGIRGVSWHEGNQMWRARASSNGQEYVRYCHTHEEAAAVVVELRRQVFTNSDLEVGAQ